MEQAINKTLFKEAVWEFFFCSQYLEKIFKFLKIFLVLLKEEYFILKSTIGRGWIKHENQHLQKNVPIVPLASALKLSISIRSLKKALNLLKNQTIDANSTKFTSTFINFFHKYIKMFKDSYYQKKQKKTYVKDVKIFLKKKNKKSTIWTWTI